MRPLPLEMTGRERSAHEKIEQMPPSTGTVNMDGLEIEITVLKTRHNFGRVDVLIAPVAGSGERWVDLNRVHPFPAAERGREEQGK